MFTQVSERINSLTHVRGMFYGWWMAGLAAIVMALEVPLFQGIAVWNPVLKGQFGWSAWQLSLAWSFTRVEASIVGPMGGVSRRKPGTSTHGTHRPIDSGSWVPVLQPGAEPLAVLPGIHSDEHRVDTGHLASNDEVLNNWFIRRKALAMAIALEGYAIGGIVVVPALAWAIGAIDPDQPDRFGWRATAAAVGVITLILALPLSRLVRNRPEEYGHQPDGRPESSTAGTATENGSPDAEAEPDYTWQEALRTRTFWLITMGSAFSCTVIVTVMVHLGLLFDTRDFSLQMIGWVVSTYTAVSAIAIIVGGYIGDRVPIRVAIFWASALQSAALIVALLADSAAIAFLFAVIMGIGFGAWTPLLSAIRGVYFGRRAFATITGWSMIPMNILILLAPFFARIMVDVTESYTVPFITIGVVSFLGSCLFLLLGEPKPVSTSPRTVQATTE